MRITNLLPPRLKVAARAAEQNARDVYRALRHPRLPPFRQRIETPDLAVPSPMPVTRVAPQAPVASPSGAALRRVVFARSGVTLELAPGETILEAGLAAGVDLDFSCTMGGCGACMLSVVEGEVEYEDVGAICLSDEEIEDGLCLICVGRPRGTAVLEA